MESIALGSRDILCCRKFFLFLLRLTGVVKQKKWRVDSFFFSSNHVHLRPPGQKVRSVFPLQPRFRNKRRKEYKQILFFFLICDRMSQTNF